MQLLLSMLDLISQMPFSVGLTVRLSAMMFISCFFRQTLSGTCVERTHDSLICSSAAGYHTRTL